MVNKVILVGNLTKPPEIKPTSKGGVVALLNLATNESWTGSWRWGWTGVYSSTNATATASTNWVN